MTNTDDKEAIERVYKTLVKSLLKKDFAKARALYVEQGAYVKSDGELTQNDGELHSELERFSVIIANMALLSRSIHVVDDIALVVVVWHWADDQSETPELQRAIDMLRKSPEGEWQFVIDNPMGL
ncbi:YybH family protein [Pseudoteredinibacter isoporae]|uniref:YybH family protein n=1 Tax=Pseudoteredinibacter isoporae TaxID=570281 RepID=UPI003106968A